MSMATIPRIRKRGNAGQDRRSSSLFLNTRLSAVSHALFLGSSTGGSDF